MAKLVDAHALGACGAIRGGSIPLPDTYDHFPTHFQPSTHLGSFGVTNHLLLWSIYGTRNYGWIN